jgi:hypothetical protein
MSEEQYRDDPQYRRRVDAMADAIQQEAANIRKKRERSERREKTVAAIIEDAKAGAAKYRQPVRIVIRINDPQARDIARRLAHRIIAAVQARNSRFA